MVVTPGRLASFTVNGPITSPVYGLIRPDNAGTEPGTRASEMREKSPIIAKRPLLISRYNFVAFSSSLKSLVKPKGSKRFSGVSGLEITP
eukprot:12424622-Karenia_brevis.AAC.1